MQLHYLVKPLALLFLAFRLTYSAPTWCSLPLAVRTIHTFPLGTWIENLAVRSNGQILTTLLNTPSVYQIDPLGIVRPILVHTFPNATALLGIVETYPDIFYLVAGKYNLTDSVLTPGSFSVWRLDMTTFSVRSHDSVPAPVKKIADFPESTLLNGMTLLDRDAGLVLIADTGLGGVWRLNVNTGDKLRIISDPLMSSTEDSPRGVNGIKIRDGTMYFTNDHLQILGRIDIDADGTPAGNASIVLPNIFGDDFTLDSFGNVLIAEGSKNDLRFVGPHDKLGNAFVAQKPPNGIGQQGGSTRVLAGTANSSALPGPTACQFGRTPLDEGSLYVTTTGGDASYLSGNFTIGGAVSRIDIVNGGC